MAIKIPEEIPKRWRRRKPTEVPPIVPPPPIPGRGVTGVTALEADVAAHRRRAAAGVSQFGREIAPPLPIVRSLPQPRTTPPTVAPITGTPPVGVEYSTVIPGSAEWNQQTELNKYLMARSAGMAEVAAAGGSSQAVFQAELERMRVARTLGVSYTLGGMADANLKAIISGWENLNPQIASNLLSTLQQYPEPSWYKGVAAPTQPTVTPGVAPAPSLPTPPEIPEIAPVVPEVPTAPTEPPRLFTQTEVDQNDALARLAQNWAIARGINPQADWLLKLTGDGVISYVLPDGWEITEDGYVSPDGVATLVYGGDLDLPIPAEAPVVEEPTTLSETDLAAMLAQYYPELILAPEDMSDETAVSLGMFPRGELREFLEQEYTLGAERMGRLAKFLEPVFPDEDIEELLEFIDKFPKGFLAEMRAIGRSGDTVALLQHLWPTITDTDMADVFGEPPPTIVERAGAELGIAWEELTTGEFTWDEVWRALGTGGALGVAGAWLRKYVETPWTSLWMRARSGFQTVIGQATQLDRDFIEAFNRIDEKYGVAGFVSEELSVAVEEYISGVEGPARVGIEIMRWTNPAYWIPIGGVIGKGAQITTKVPIVGASMKWLAAGVLGVEKGIVFPIVAPVKLGIKGLERLGKSLGEATANRLVKQAKHLDDLTDGVLPSTESVLDFAVADNWLKGVSRILSRVPVVGKPFIRAIDPRLLVRRQSKLVEDVAGRGAITRYYFETMGMNLRTQNVLKLRSVSADPVKLFGFSKETGITTKLTRLTKDASGTLEDVFLSPNKYALNTVQKEYVESLNEMLEWLLKVERKEGIAKAGWTVKDYIHRVVLGRYNEAGELILVRGRPGMGSRALGAKAAFEKPRKFPTQAEGVEAGIVYSPNPEEWIGSHIEDALIRVGDRRASEIFAPFGKTPSELLAERFPEVKQAAALNAKELSDLNQFEGAINRVLRGEKLPTQTLAAIEGRFPELGIKLRALVAEPKAIGAVRDYLGGVRKTLPTKQAMREGLELLSAEERLAYRSVAESAVHKTADKGAKRIIKVLDDIDANPKFIPKTGIETDMFGYLNPLSPAGKFRLTRISMDEYLALVESRAKAGLPPPDAVIKPQVKGIKGLASETKVFLREAEIPLARSATLRMAELKALRAEIKTLREPVRVNFWKSKGEYKLAMEKVRTPGIEEGYIMQPMFGGKIYGRDFVDAVNQWFGHKSGIGALQYTAEFAGILRITKAALDFSWHIIQGMAAFGLAHAYLLVSPAKGARMMGEWYKALGYTVTSFFKPEVFYNLFKAGGKFARVSEQRAIYGGSTTAVLFQELELRTTIGRKAYEVVMHGIPLKPFQRAEVSFLAAGEYIRNTFWEIMSPMALKAGQGFELATFLDRMTGIIDTRAMGIPLIIRQLEQSFVWFAPRYTRACLSLLAHAFRGGFVAGEARKALIGMAGAGSAYFATYTYYRAKLDGKTDEQAQQAVLEGFGVKTDPITGETVWQPTGRFMTIEVEGQHFGVGGFWYGLVRLTGNILATIDEVGDREVVDLVRILKDGRINRNNPFIYWWFTRSSPLTTNIEQLINNTDFMGYPIAEGKDWAWESPGEFGKYVAKMFMPIWVEQGLLPIIAPSWARDQEVPEEDARALIIAGELFGLRIFPEGQWEKFYDYANETVIPNLSRELLAEYFSAEELQSILDLQRDDKLSWKQLPDPLQIRLRAMYPNLEELYEEAVADSSLRNSPLWKQWTGVTDEAKSIYYDRGSGLVTRLKSGELDTRELREAWSEAGQNYGVSLDTIARDPTYEDIYNRFAELQKDGAKYDMWMFQVYAEYTSVMFQDFVDENGDFDWDARDQVIDDFIEKYGEDTYETIKRMFAEKKFLEGVDPVLIRMANDKDKLGREYWRLPWKPFIELEEGDVPAEFLSLWREYEVLETDAERDAFLETNPDLGRDWRGEFRLKNPEADAMLALWGYGGKLQTREAYDLVVKWAGELGIPLEQIGLGLPPQSLINDYFTYNKISKEFSGNSAEAKLYRMEHTSWDAWGQETWGWKPLDENIEALRIKVKYAELYDLYNAYGDWKSPKYVEDDKARKAARDKLLAGNPTFRDARWLAEALDAGFPDMQARNYARYMMASTGNARLFIRCKDSAFDAALVEFMDYKPAYGTSRCRVFK